MQKFLDSLTKENITAIYGPASTGKTTISILSAYNQIKEGNKTIYIDTENSFPLERFWQISNSDNKSLDNLILLKAKNFLDQHEKIKLLPEICNKTKISLIIIDSLSSHYRRLVKHKPDFANGLLISQLKILKSLNIPIIMTNQVYELDGIKMVGHSIVSKFTDNIIELKKDPRIMNIKKLNKGVLFEITNDGIKFLKSSL